MAKKNKLSTPAWIMEGFDSEDAYNKSKGVKSEKKKGPSSGSPKALNSGSKTFKIRECPKCGSDEVGVDITGEECKGGECNWECRKCKWKGQDIVEKELTEKELMEYMDKKGEDIA